MSDDPIVEEVREARARLLAECGGDFNRYMDRIHREGASTGGPRVGNAAELRDLLARREPRKDG